jgi:hypothetical protein
MTVPCPSCNGALVEVGLLAGHIMVYSCPECSSWYDMQLRAIGSPIERAKA